VATTEKTRGVFYIATGSEYYIQEAIKSAISFKRYNAEFPVSLFTDYSGNKLSLKIFDEVIKISSLKHPFKTKVECIEKVPYDLNIFLDTDTKVVASISELYELLEQTDLLAAKAPYLDWSQRPPIFKGYEHPTEFNTGFIGINKNDSSMNFLNTWSTRIEKYSDVELRKDFGDQNVFNSILADNILINIKVVPNTVYNARDTMLKRMKEDNLIDKIKIFHHNGVFNNKSVIKKVSRIIVDFFK